MTSSVDWDKLCIYNVIPIVVTKTIIHRDIFKNTTDKSKWNNKNVQVTWRKERKKKQRNEGENRKKNKMIDLSSTLTYL